MTSVLDLRDRLMPKLPVKPTGVPASEVARALTPPSPLLVTETEDRIVFTAPVSELAMVDHLYVKLSGRFVEAEKANRNGAFWTAGDLEFGLPTVAYGPLNWLHEERKVVGVINDARMVNREAAAAMSPAVGPHIAADAVLWRWLYPQETRVVERAADERKLWYSMECISPQIECVGDHGCGAKMPYLDALRREGAACAHVKDRSATRRFVQPIFQGGAIIVPPVQPGWASADIQVVRQTASYLENDPEAKIMAAGLTDEEATAMVQQVLEYSGRKAA